jgi:methionyl-tRNA formyltransferase
MDARLDTGPVCLGRGIAISPDMNAGQLHDALSKLGAELMVDALARLEKGKLECIPQPSEGATYASKIGKSETRIDFERPAKAVVDFIRGLSPRPGAWFEAKIGGKQERVKVLEATPAEGSGVAGILLDDELTIACGKGAVRLQRLQRAGKQPMEASEFLRGTRIAPGARFS